MQGHASSLPTCSGLAQGCRALEMIFAYHGCLHPHAILRYLGINCITKYGTSGLCAYLSYKSTVLHLLCFTTTLTVPCLSNLPCCIATVSSFTLLHHPASAVLHCYCHGVLPAFISAALSLLDGSGSAVPCSICLSRYHRHDALLLIHHVALQLQGLRPWESLVGLCPPLLD